MRVLLTGESGQLGNECKLIAPTGCDLIAPTIDELDLTQLGSLSALVNSLKPDFVIHAAAYTVVDQAESSEKEAMLINAEATRVIAESVAELGASMAYVSTDYVFSGIGSEPWAEDSPLAPVNAYGRTKLAGEEAVRECLGDRGHIVRTSWLYGRCGNNFIRTMLRHMKAGKALKVIDDQKGSPTWAGGLAEALWALAQDKSGSIPPMLHYTDGGITSWHDFAQQIRQEGLTLGLDLIGSSVTPCGSEEYLTPAPRPAWSPMRFSDAWSQLCIQQNSWQKTLAEALPLLLQEDTLTI